MISIFALVATTILSVLFGIILGILISQSNKEENKEDSKLFDGIMKECKDCSTCSFRDGFRVCKIINIYNQTRGVGLNDG